MPSIEHEAPPLRWIGIGLSAHHFFLLREYRSLVGSLLYCAVTVRTDIAYAVGMLSRALNTPTPRLLDEAKRVLYYLVQTAVLGLRTSAGRPSASTA